MKFDDYYLKKYYTSKYYLGVNLSEVLFADYWMKFKKEPQKYDIKYIIKIIIGIFCGIFMKFKIKFNKDKELYKNKIFFILNHSNKENRSNKINIILENLILEFKKENIVLIVFNQFSYDKFNKLNYNVIYIKKVKYFVRIKDLTFSNLKTKNIFEVSKCVPIIKCGDLILKEISPSLVLTTQDYYYEDNIFTQLAKKYKIPTIGHLHALILKKDGDVGKFKYFFSDYIMLWGQRDVEILKEYLPAKKLFAIGSGKFKKLLQNREKLKKHIVLCMTGLTLGSVKENKIVNSFISIKTDCEKIIKLHPRTEKERFIKNYEQILGNIKVEKDYKFIEEAKYLITYQTTSIIDGLCCGASVIDIFINEKDRDGELLTGLEDSVVSIENLEKEIIKREENKEYFDEIMLKQEKVLKRIIYSFDSEKIEKEIIDKILKEQEETKKC